MERHLSGEDFKTPLHNHIAQSKTHLPAVTLWLQLSLGSQKPKTDPLVCGTSSYLCYCLVPSFGWRNESSPFHSLRCLVWSLLIPSGLHLLGFLDKSCRGEGVKLTPKNRLVGQDSLFIYSGDRVVQLYPGHWVSISVASFNMRGLFWGILNPSQQTGRSVERITEMC